jgi:hypothetical protein
MERHDPLSQFSPPVETPPAPPTPATKKRGRKAPPVPPLLREVAEVADDTLAFLFAGPRQQPGDYERCQAQAAEIRRAFVAFCETHLHHTAWRQAWSAFMATKPALAPAPEPPPTESIIPVNFAAPGSDTCPLPRWRQRMQTIQWSR